MIISDSKINRKSYKVYYRIRKDCPCESKGSFPHGDTDEPYFPVNGIGFISTDKSSEIKPGKDEEQKINDARLILFTSFISQNNTITKNSNTGHGMASSENYKVINFTVVAGIEYMTEYTGFVIPSWHGGISINKNILIRPRYVPTPSFRINTDVLNSLIRLRIKKKRAFRRIISAIEVFYESFYNLSDVSYNARILLQASAFEILLKAHSGAGREKVKAFIKKESNYPEEKILTFKSERSNGKLVKETGTIKEKWADRFFSLRNHIVHGNIPSENEYNFGSQRHFDIALLFFIFCIKRKIEDELKNEIFGDDVVWKTWTDDLHVEPIEYTGFEYESLGRRAWERMMNKVNKNFIK